MTSPHQAQSLTVNTVGLRTEWSSVGSAAAGIVLLVPFWIGSVWIERRTLVKRLPNAAPAKILTAVVRGNLATYSIFLAFGCFAMANAIEELPNRKQIFEKFRNDQEQSKQLRSKEERMEIRARKQAEKQERPTTP